MLKKLLGKLLRLFLHASILGNLKRRVKCVLQSGEGGDPFQITRDAWIDPRLREYVNGSYVLANVLEPWSGYWVVNISDETVELLIPPKMFVPEEAAD